MNTRVRGQTAALRRLERVLVRRGSKFGLLGDIEQRTHILRELFGGMLGASPSPPGFIALGHQQVLPIVLADFERTEAGAAERTHCP